jgi:pyruvate dehydrogenase E2 component (dihydrolipoamide acetyltransferase)
MPQVADDPTSATLTAWLVGESGDFVGAQSIATVETDSSVLSIEVAEPGVLIKSLVSAGDHVEPGRPLAVLGAPGEVIEDVEKLMVQLGLAVAPEAGVHARAVASYDQLFATTWPPHETSELEAEAEAEAEVAAPPEAPVAEAPVAEAPVVEAPVVEASVVETADAEATASPQPTAEAQPGQPNDEAVVVRRVVGWADRVAEAVVDAVLVAEPRVTVRRTVPQVQLRDVVRADKLLEIVAELDTVSLMALVVKAVAVTSRKVPLRPSTSTSRSPNAEIAVQRWTAAGAVTPVVHVANLMTVSSLTTTLNDLDQRAHAGRLAASELEPASVTIVDLGAEGVAEGYLDATGSQAAVLTLGAVVVRPVVAGGTLVPGRVMTLSLSCDAQRVEAGVAARWMAHLTGLLEQPLQFLT